MSTIRMPGQIRLNARHDGSGDTAGLVMTGSDLMSSRPVGLCIKAPQENACMVPMRPNADYARQLPGIQENRETFSLNIQGRGLAGGQRR